AAKSRNRRCPSSGDSKAALATSSGVIASSACRSTFPSGYSRGRMTPAVYPAGPRRSTEKGKHGGGAPGQRGGHRVGGGRWLRKAGPFSCTIARSAGGPVVRFAVHVRNDIRDRVPPLVRLKTACGPNDDGSPCITVMVPDEG